MLYKKPKGVKYTDMAIYVDNHIYTDDYDEDLVFVYLYHLAYMLARKNNWFKRADYYENYSVYTATRVFLRLTNPKQYIIKEDGEPKMSKIKSCLNYMKMIAYPCKVDFEQQEYAQTLIDKEDDEYNIQYTFSAQLADSIDKMNLVEFKYCLGDIIETARNYIDKIPYRTQSKKWENIYLSCLLTYLNSITIRKTELNRLKGLKNQMSAVYSLDEAYASEVGDNVILYHLKDNMHDYIYVLTNGMRKAMANDLCNLLHTYIPSTSGMKNLIFNELTGESMNQE